MTIRLRKCEVCPATGFSSSDFEVWLCDACNAAAIRKGPVPGYDEEGELIKFCHLCGDESKHDYCDKCVGTTRAAEQFEKEHAADQDPDQAVWEYLDGLSVGPHFK